MTFHVTIFAYRQRRPARLIRWRSVDLNRSEGGFILLRLGVRVVQKQFSQHKICVKLARRGRCQFFGSFCRGEKKKVFARARADRAE